MAVRKVISKDFDDKKCPSCNWRVTRGYSFEENDIDEEGAVRRLFHGHDCGRGHNRKHEGGDGIMAERILFSISESYVQECAKEKIGRKLTEEELHSVGKGA